MVYTEYNIESGSMWSLLAMLLTTNLYPYCQLCSSLTIFLFHNIEFIVSDWIYTHTHTQLAENYDSLFFEASAKNGTNCSKVGKCIVTNINLTLCNLFSIIP